MKQLYIFLLQTEAAVEAESPEEAWLQMAENLPAGHEIKCLKGTQIQVDYSARTTYTPQPL